MNLIDLAVKRPVSTAVIFIGICATGFFSWGFLPREVMPDLNFPQLSVVTEYALAGPQEIENLVTKPVEEALGTVKNVKRLRSVSREGRSLVTVEFAWGTDMDFASLNVREKLDLVKAKLPPETNEPMVVKYNPFQTPVLILSLTMEGEMDPLFLSHIAEKTFVNQLQKVSGVAAVTLAGTRDPEIHVDLDQNRLAANKVSLTQFARGLSQANYQGSAGTVEDKSFDYSVRVKSAFESADDVRNAVVAIDKPEKEPSYGNKNKGKGSMARQRQREAAGDQRLIHVSHLGVVSEGLKERESFSRRDGKENITLLVQKQASASTIRTVQRVRERLGEMERLLPSDVSLEIVFDQARVIKQGLRDVLQAVVLGGILAFITLFFFLGSWRSAVLVSVVIPVATLGTLAAMNLFQISLNTISLGGLALGVGMLVDAAICVTENIHRRQADLGEDPFTAAVSGTKEVAAPIISSCLTTVSVFLPLVFVVGLIGQLFHDLSITVAISQIMAIIVAMTLVPMLAARLGRQPGGCHSPSAKASGDKSGNSQSGISFVGLQSWLSLSLERRITRPKSMAAAVLIALFVSVLLMKAMPKQFLPRVDTDQLMVKLTMPKGTRLEKTNAIGQRIEAELLKHPDVAHVTANTGSSSDQPINILEKNESRLLVDLKKKRRSTADRLRGEFSNLIAKLSLDGGETDISKVGGPLSFTQNPVSPIMLHLKGTKLENLKKAAKSLTGQLAAIEGVTQVRDSMALPAPEIQLTIKKDRAARIGLSATDIGRGAQMAFHGRDVTRIYKDGKDIPVRVRLREEHRKDARHLKNLLVSGPNGRVWPLNDVGSVRIGEGPSEVARLDQERFVLVRAEKTSAFSRSSQKALDGLINDFSNPGVSLEETGEKQARKESFVSLSFTLLIAIALVFAVMAVQFESLKQPLFILVTIPLSVIGMAAGLFITGKTVNAIAGLGLLLLAGIVVNNGIVLIDFINTQKGKNTDLKKALLEGVRVRLRPIVLTAVTTIVGLIPLALGLGEGAELQAPMAVTVIFGLLVSTVLTLFVLPTLYYRFEKKSSPGN